MRPDAAIRTAPVRFAAMTLPIAGLLLMSVQPSAAQDARNAAENAGNACGGDNGGITLSPGFCATVFADNLCIECDACEDICPVDCITFTKETDEADLRTRLKAPALNLTQDLYVSGTLKTGRVMVKDEDVCLHCGLCAERCPTGAWDMQKFSFDIAQAGPRCRDAQTATEPA